MTAHPKVLVDRVAEALAAVDSVTLLTDFDAVAVAVLDALLVDPIVVQTLRDSRREITWPDDPAPHESRLVACTRDLLKRLVDDTARTVAELHDAKADLDRIGAELEQLRAATAPAPVRWTGPDPRDEGYTEAEIAAAWTLITIGRLPTPDQYLWTILRDNLDARAWAVRSANIWADKPQEHEAVAEAARVLKVAP